MPNFEPFTVPAMSDADMHHHDQGYIVGIQATAMIISSYLEHATAVHNKALDAGVPWNDNDLARFRVNSSELIGTIKGIQDELKYSEDP